VQEQVASGVHADPREATLELADRAAQRFDLVEQRRGGLREQGGLAGELALRLDEPAIRRVARADRVAQILPRACEVARERA